MPVDGDKWLKAQDDIPTCLVLSTTQSYPVYSHRGGKNHMIKVAVDYLNSWQLINKSLQL